MEIYPMANAPLDPSAYNLDEEERTFFKAVTGIQDDDELRDHVLQVQAEAYAVYPYPCIRRLSFIAFKIAKYPAYDAIIKLGKERKDAILLDLGCCFGNDARKAIFDGFPLQNVVASDLRAEFWDLGNKLFKQSPENFPVCFVPGDIFDPSFLSPDASPAPSSSSAPQPGPTSPLSQLTSLTPLQHRISVINAGAFFHLFDEPQQRRLAHLLGTLLSPFPGSMIVGSHMGLPDTEEYKAAGGMRQSFVGKLLYAHSPTSWKNLWAGSNGVFESQDVTVWATAKEVEREVVAQACTDPMVKVHMVTWSVTRV